EFGFSSKQFRKYCIISTMQRNLEVAKPLGPAALSFLNFCRIEKGLASNTISSYRSDLERLSGFISASVPDAEPEILNSYLASLERERGLLRVIGKGNKERLVPFGDPAGAALDRYLSTARPGLLKGRASRHLFVTARGSAMTRQSFWTLLKKHGRAVGIFHR